MGGEDGNIERGRESRVLKSGFGNAHCVSLPISVKQRKDNQVRVVMLEKEIYL